MLDDTAPALREAARRDRVLAVYPHNMNYHVEHHLYPAIPHYRLPQAHLALAELGLLEQAEISPGLGESLRRIARPAAS